MNPVPAGTAKGLIARPLETFSSISERGCIAYYGEHVKLKEPRKATTPNPCLTWIQGTKVAFRGSTLVDAEIRVHFFMHFSASLRAANPIDAICKVHGIKETALCQVITHFSRTRIATRITPSTNAHTMKIAASTELTAPKRYSTVNASRHSMSRHSPLTA